MICEVNRVISDQWSATGVISDQLTSDDACGAQLKYFFSNHQCSHVVSIDQINHVILIRNKHFLI